MAKHARRTSRRSDRFDWRWLLPVGALAVMAVWLLTRRRPS